MPAKSARSSETGCAKRLRFATQSTVSCEPSGRVEIAQIREHFAIGGIEKCERAAAEDLEELAQRDHVARPVQQAGLIAELRLHVHHLVAIDGVHDDGEVEPRGIAAREAGVAVGGPLHGRAHAVAVAEIDVVAHADLVAVVENRRAGKAEQQRIEQLDAAAIVVDQRSQPAANAHVDAHARIGGVGEVHVVALVVGHHLERELVVIAQEETPLAVVGDGRRLRHDVGDGQAIFLAQRHVDARHERKVKSHVAFVAVTEVGAHIRGPLVGFGENQAGCHIRRRWRRECAE